MQTKDGTKSPVQKNEALMRLLKRHRLSKGLTLAALASRLKTHTSTVQAWEDGRNLPRPATIPKLARILDVDPLELTRIMAPDPTPVALSQN